VPVEPAGGHEREGAGADGDQSPAGGGERFDEDVGRRTFDVGDSRDADGAGGGHHVEPVRDAKAQCPGVDLAGRGADPHVVGGRG